MDCFLKCIQWVHPAVFCSQDFFLVHNNAPAHEAASVCQFLTPKNVTTLYHRLVLSRFISARLFFVHQFENQLKGLHFADVAEIQEAITAELKKVQNEKFSAAFQNLYDCAKVCIYANGAYFEFKKVRVFLMCRRFLKKLVLKLLDRTV